MDQREERSDDAEISSEQVKESFSSPLLEHGQEHVSDHYVNSEHFEEEVDEASIYSFKSFGEEIDD